jgi:nickel transport protein
MFKKTGFSLLIFLAILGSPVKTLGHAVETNYLLFSDVAAESKNDLDTQVNQTRQGLELESVYSTGEPLEQAQVEIYAPNNTSEPWLVGTTDNEGKFSFIPDPSIPGDWEIAILQDGHEDYLTVPVKADGIQFDLISQGHKKDVHYAFSELNSWKILGLVAISATGIWGLRNVKKSQ